MKDLSSRTSPVPHEVHRDYAIENAMGGPAPIPGFAAACGSFARRCRTTIHANQHGGD